MRIIRVRQWVKNFFVFVPLFFGGAIMDMSALWAGCVTFAAFCFAGNPRIYGKILNSPFFGDYVRAWKEKRVIPMRARLQGIAMVWIVLIVTMIFFMTADWQRILLCVVGIGVTIHLLTVFRKGRTED